MIHELHGRVVSKNLSMACIETDSDQHHLKTLFVLVSADVKPGDKGKLVYTMYRSGAWWEFYKEEGNE